MNDLVSGDCRKGGYLYICCAFKKSKPYINNSSCKKKRKLQNRVAFGLKRGGGSKIDCSNATLLCIFPSFRLNRFLVTDIHRNINHIVWLVFIQVSFHYHPPLRKKQQPQRRSCTHVLAISGVLLQMQLRLTSRRKKKDRRPVWGVAA